ncbi:FHIPEP family type III secretion protein [Paracoccus sp. (in: a-proteobacteria)]|uniref:FHIPEP family type III secretion protein n=1 Tax=Paracoccus sp. TaxID=267 RepID=UPI00289BF785|nr:FHIPEP family type III secretion protein [Paracoccus sp. (in: a-proteobacteria)]
MSRHHIFNIFTGSLRSFLITGGLVLVVVSMVVPIPAVFLDVGFSFSIAISMMILAMAALVDKPTDFQSFPVLLLLALIVRLSLTVSSTRLILTNGDQGKEAAGQVISGFAEFVAGGSLLVGLTVFAVISVVNFLVITKGSGRMAEVSARFALDSLPGKQLAIDGDLSSGAIDHEQAKQRRIQEQREISFYGSLDGASKFVKGDAVAGLVITLINLIVGLAAGVLVHKMPASEALATYSHLTIGDGLVAQVPALITSMAAALLLSRGGATENTSDLLTRQIGGNWQALAIVSACLMLLSLVPGMPTLVFVSLSVLADIGAVLSVRRDSGEINSAIEVEENHSPIASQPRIGDLLDADEISIEISPILIATALDESRGLSNRINNLRVHVAKKFGIILPDVRITDGKDFDLGSYVIRIHGVIRGKGTLRPHDVLALGSEDVLRDLQGARVSEPVYNTPAMWIDIDDQDDAAVNGATVVTPMEILSTHLLEVVRVNLPNLLTVSGLQRMIQELRDVSDESRALINQRFFDNMIPDKVSPDLLLSVLRLLLAERISIRNLIFIIDAVYEARGAENTQAVYEAVRRRLRGQITEQYTTDEGNLNIVQLHPEWEAEFTRTELEAGRQSQVPILQIQQRLAGAVKAALSSVAGDVSPVLAVADHRLRLVRSILDASSVAVPVLGLDEIEPSAQVRIVGTVAA